METPFLEIDLNKIGHNASKLKEMLAKKDIEIVFITKGFSANLDVIKKVNDTGIKYFGDSRLDNIIKVKESFPNLCYTLIRIPKISELDLVVQYCDYSLQSELSIIEMISQKATAENKVHNIILMVDVGDLREGVLIEDVLPNVAQILKFKGVKLVGIGTNVGCYGSIIPSVENTKILADLKARIKETFDYEISFISGGSTCTLELALNDKLAKDINLLRVGEAILLGEDSTNNKKITDFYDDAFILGAEIVELKNKPSFPIGERGKDAFGKVVEYVDYGNIDRAILAIGRQDVIIEALEPLDENIKVLGGSSDHMILDVTTSKEKLELGDVVKFRCSYSAVLSSTTSKYVKVITK